MSAPPSAHPLQPRRPLDPALRLWNPARSLQSTPGYSIPASPGPLRSARAGSHPQPPLARGTPGPSSPRSSSGSGDGRRKAGGGDGEGGARRRGPARGSQGHRVRPLIQCLCVRPRWTTSPGRPRGGAESRSTGAPRGSLGLRVPLPERLWTTSPGRPRGGTGSWRRGHACAPLWGWDPPALYLVSFLLSSSSALSSPAPLSILPALPVRHPVRYPLRDLPPIRLPLPPDSSPLHLGGRAPFCCCLSGRTWLAAPTGS